MSAFTSPGSPRRQIGLTALKSIPHSHHLHVDDCGCRYSSKFTLNGHNCHTHKAEFKKLGILIFHSSFQLYFMSYKVVQAFVLAALVVLSTTQQAPAPAQSFPELLWGYWDGDLSNPKTEIFLKLCFNNMREYAARSGWKFHLVTNDNLHEFLSPDNYDDCLQLLALVGNEFRQKRADIIRLYLLKENGGMWIDSSTFFIEELRWVNQIHNTNIPIMNRIGDSPDLITFRMEAYDKPGSQVFDAELGMEVSVSPGLQNWAIIAKPNTEFINEALTLIRQLLTQNQTYIDQKIRQHGVQLSPNANNSYFRFGIYTFQIVLQVRQSQLNSVTESGRSKYAVADFKIWTISGTEMGFCLEAITEGITPFFNAIFLFSDVAIIEDYRIRLRGFIKLGGIKRWYIEMIMETILNPEMCENFVRDAFKLNNQSYIYHYLIENNQEPTGLALKNSINHRILKQQSQEELQCEMSTQNQQQLQHASSIIHLLYLGSILALVATLTLLCRSPFSCSACPISKSGDSIGCVNHFKQFWTKYRSLCVWGLVVALVVLVFLGGSNGSTQDVCSGVTIGPADQQMELSKQYLSEIRASLPQDNGTFLQMFFQQYIQKLTDDLSTFVGVHYLSFIGYFQDYIAGSLLCGIVVLAGTAQLVPRMRSQIVKRKFGLGVIRTVLLLLLLGIILLSCVVVARSYLLKTNLDESICFFTQIPEYFSASNNAATENQAPIVDFVNFSDIFSSQFETISMILIAFKGDFVMKSRQYEPELQQVQLQMLASLQNQELSRLLNHKQDLTSAFSSQMLDLTDTLACENRVIEVMKLFTDYLKNIIRRAIFFLDHYTSLEKLSFIATSIPIAFSLLFCILNALTFWRFVLCKGKVRPQERRSFMGLGIAGLVLSLAFNFLTLSNYYFCDFVTAFKVSLEGSSSFLSKILPIQCMSDTTSDVFLLTLEQNFRLRQQHFQHFVDLYPRVDSLTSYPFDRERQLLSAYSQQNQASNFLASNEKYNEMLHRFSQEYYERKKEIEVALSTKYTIEPRNSLIKEIETALYQPLCVFNFTTLYQLVSFFKYLGFLNLLAYFASLLLPPVSQKQEEKAHPQQPFKWFDNGKDERNSLEPEIGKASPANESEIHIEGEFKDLTFPATTDFPSWH